MSLLAAVRSIPICLFRRDFSDCLPPWQSPLSCCPAKLGAGTAVAGICPAPTPNISAMAMAQGTTPPCCGCRVVNRCASNASRSRHSVRRTTARRAQRALLRRWDQRCIANWRARRKWCRRPRRRKRCTRCNRVTCRTTRSCASVWLSSASCRASGSLARSPQLQWPLGQRCLSRKASQYV